jgi:hypothetical protein
MRLVVHIRNPHAWSAPMNTLSKFQNNDANKDGAWKQAMLLLGLLTAVAVVAVILFAST